MATKTSKTIDINALQALKGQVDGALNQSELNRLGEAVLNRALGTLIDKLAVTAPGGRKDWLTRDYVDHHATALDAVQAVLPDAVIDVSVKKDGVFGKKLTSVRIRPTSGASAVYVGTSTKAHVSPALALVSAFVNALEDKVTREVSAARRDGTVSSVNAPGDAKGEVVLDSETQGKAEDRVKERLKASGTTRTSLRPTGFKAPASQRRAGVTTGSLKNPAGARLSKAPTR